MKQLSILIVGAIMMTGCGGSSETSADSTALPVDSSAQVVSIPQPDTTLAAASPPASSDAQAPVDTTVPAGAVSSGAEGADGTGLSAPGIGSMDQLITTLGITDPTDVACIEQTLADNGGSLPSEGSGAVDDGVIRAILTCQPPTVVQLAVQQLSARLPKATTEQATCAVKATLSALATAEQVDFAALAGGASSLPSSLRSELRPQLTTCGLSEADLLSYLGS
jgi:hypothetical protein